MHIRNFAVPAHVTAPKLKDGVQSKGRRRIDSSRWSCCWRVDPEARSWNGLYAARILVILTSIE